MKDKPSIVNVFTGNTMTLNLILQLRKMSLNYGQEEGDATFLEHGVTTKAFTLVCQIQIHLSTAI